jgi:hypothetical protein
VRDSARVGNNARVGGNAWVTRPCQALIPIQGSQHFVTIQDSFVQIGCTGMTKTEWLGEKGEDAARHAGYTQEQITEYKRYIELATDS